MELFTGNSFTEIAFILALATLMGILGQKLRQPLIIMFLAAGILAGPSYLGIIQSYHEIELLAHIGIALLLFIVGLKLDFGLIRTIGPVALATGLGQIIFTSVIGFGIALALGMETLSAAYVAVALTFSSTIIIVKLLSDKKEIDSLHGQIAIGFLIVQDIAAILALVALTTYGASVTAEDSVLATTLQMAGKGFGLLLVVGLLMRYVLPEVTRRLAYSLELLTLFAITWAVFLSASSELLGFSREVGAFLAGISLASTNYRDAIGGRLVSLRDFLLLFFFIDLGARLDWSTAGSQLGASFIFSIFVLIGNPIIVLIIMGFMGYRRRTGFMAGLTVAQISEFSLIVAALGLSLGHINDETMGLITLVGVVTIFTSTYMILYSEPLYRFLSTPLKIFERRNPYRETAVDMVKPDLAAGIIIVGLGNYGSSLAENLLRRNKNLIGVDFDPASIEKWREKDISVLYGDIGDPEVYYQLPLDKAQWVVSSIRSRALNLSLLQTMNNQGYAGKIALTATNPAEADEFEKAGAHLVFRPFTDASEKAADALSYAIDFLPENVNWPIMFLEVRLRADAAVAGQFIKDIPLRSTTGASILAVSRAGRTFYDIGPEFMVYPADMLLIMGHPSELKDAETLLNHVDVGEDEGNVEHFDMVEMKVGAESNVAGQSLAALRFRQEYGVTVIGIRRGEEQITKIEPSEQLQLGDGVIVIGTTSAIERLREEVHL